MEMKQKALFFFYYVSGTVGILFLKGFGVPEVYLRVDHPVLQLSSTECPLSIE